MICGSHLLLLLLPFAAALARPGPRPSRETALEAGGARNEGRERGSAPPKTVFAFVTCKFLSSLSAGEERLKGEDYHQMHFSNLKLPSRMSKKVKEGWRGNVSHAASTTEKGLAADYEEDGGSVFGGEGKRGMTCSEYHVLQTRGRRQKRHPPRRTRKKKELRGGQKKRRLVFSVIMNALSFQRRGKEKGGKVLWVR